MSGNAPAAGTLRPAPLLGGVALLVIYMRIGAVIGYQAGYGPPLPPHNTEVGSPFVYVTGSEFRFWLAHLAFAIPGALLISWGLAPRIAPLLRRLVARIDNATPRGWRLAGALLFLGLFAWSLAGHYLVLLDRPLTDDENAVTFGARILASGRLTVPNFEPVGAFMDLFTFQRDGTITAMDFPGVLMFGALAILTKLGPALYAIACATSGVAVAAAAGRWFGARGRVIAAVLWIASPMIAALSITSHGHVPSRMLFALVLLCAARLDTAAGTPRRDAILLGLFAGLGFLCRPFETACLLAPLGAWLTWRSLKTTELPRATPLWMFGAVVPSIAVFALYNRAITGVWYLQARFAPGVTGGTPSLRQDIGDRLAMNLGWNALMLAITFLGIPMLAALFGGLERRRPITLVLGAGAVIGFLLCLTHDNTGIHSVGPIHLSEMSVFLVVIATAGIVRGFAWLADRGIDRIAAAALLAGYLAIACTAFNLSNLGSLRMQATTQGIPEDTLEAMDVHHAIVMARSYIVLLQVDKSFAPWGSWVLEYPHPHPDLSDDILWVKPNAKPDALHAAFPDRAIYKLTYHAEAPNLRVELVREANR